MHRQISIEYNNDINAPYVHVDITDIRKHCKFPPCDKEEITQNS